MNFQLKQDIDPIAIYAAVVATLNLFWSVVQWWRSGPRLVGQVMSNMLIVEAPNKTFVSLKLDNRGSRSTTVTTVCLSVYDQGFWRRHQRRPGATLVMSPWTVKIPITIAPGDFTTLAVLQDPGFHKASVDGVLYFEVLYSDSNKSLIYQVPRFGSNAPLESFSAS